MFYMQKHAMRYCSKSEVKNELVQEELAQGKAQKDSTRLRKQNEKVKAMRELLEKSKGEEATEDMAKAIREHVRVSWISYVKVKSKYEVIVFDLYYPYYDSFNSDKISDFAMGHGFH